MGYTKREFGFLSSDGKNTVMATVYSPDGGETRGVVQLSHGMIDYVARYEGLAEFLTSHGFILAGNEHLGHGRSASSADDLGYFGEKDGYLKVLEDLKEMNSLLHKEYPDLPVILFGHSMGSFLARLYVARYPETVTAAVIHGTGGKNPAAPAGKLLVSLLRAFLGSKHRSKFVTGVAFGSYNSHYDKSEGANAWLTRDGATVATRDTDPYTSYIFTLAGYYDLFTMLDECNRVEWYSAYPKALPTLIMSGDDDPVGDYGKGVREVYEGLLASGVERLDLKLYSGARHELFNEINREEVFSDLLAWLESVIL